ncbi:hypothetical protein BH11ACT2_BH11ACT2_10690 [soil metagenome]
MKLRRALVASVVLIGALFSAQLVVSAPAQAAAGTILCQGWTGCEANGMTTHGYKSKASTEYWRMVSGHNCTNYAAYMMVLAGMANVRPWTGDGNATGWGPGNSQSTDKTPTVGSIAWWSAGQHGAGSAGHVAYVEQVTADKIVISEDNYGGDFYWRVIKRTDSTWPSGFIHLKDATTSASFPAFRGRSLGQTAYTDQTKTRTVSLSTMKPGSTAWLSLSFQNTGDTAWDTTRVVTAGATSTIGGAGWLSPNSPAVQKQTSVITGGTATYSFPITVPSAPDGTSFSESFSVVLSDGTPIPYSSAKVTFTVDTRVSFVFEPALGIAGTPTQGRALTATTGTWDPVQPTLAYSWLRDGKAIAGASGATYTTTASDVGHRVSLAAVANAPGYLPVAQSAVTASIVKSQYGYKLAKAKSVRSGAQLVSTNGRYQLLQGTTGRLVVVDRFTKKILWSNKVKAKGAHTKLRSDGVLVTYAKSGKVMWHTPTSIKKVSYAKITTTGKLALYTSSGKVAWKSKK